MIALIEVRYYKEIKKKDFIIAKELNSIDPTLKI